MARIWQVLISRESDRLLVCYIHHPMAASSELDCSEYTQLTFSWTVKGLKALFDASLVLYKV